jgi:hypothetical protein
VSSPERLQDIAVSDNGFVFDPWTGASFTVNTSGLCLLRGLREGLGREQLVARMIESFERRDGVAGGDAELYRDVDEFVTLLRQNELLPPDFQVPR